MPAFRMLTFYITMSTIIVHVDFLLIFMGFPRFCPHYLCYVDKSWTNCHLWTNLSFFLFLTIPYFIRVCEVIYHNSFYTFFHFRMKTLFLYYQYHKTLFILIISGIISIYIYCIISTNFIYAFLFFANKMQTMFTFFYDVSI